jgi:hypothetical protein
VSQRKARLGALSPRYAFVLNPYVDTRFSTCPRCKSKTRVRKIPLVIHVEVEPIRLVILRKTCRLCVACETIIVQQAEIEPLIAVAVGAAITPDYVVLGTIEPRAWRRGLTEAIAIREIVQHMSDFKAYMRVEITPQHWEKRSADP